MLKMILSHFRIFFGLCPNLAGVGVLRNVNMGL